MPRATLPPLPSVARVLQQAGENVRLARLRRGFSQAEVAARAGMSRLTLRALERGSANVSLGAWANVLHVLGLEGDLAKVALADELGRQLQDAALPGVRSGR